MDVTQAVEVLEGWGLASFARSRVYRPRTVEQVLEALADARRRELTVAHRGAGQSYGDAALNEGGAVIEMRGLDRIVDVDAECGVVHAQAGVTIGQLWQHVLPLGWWPPVVPGTMAPTLGGCVAMNVHGKNAMQAGAIGEQVEELTLLRPSEDVVQLGHANRVGFHSIVGAQGLNGTILTVKLRLKRVHSGYLEVEPSPVSSLDEALERFDALVAASDYTVGWLDTFSGGRSLGRGILHAARYIPPDHRLAGKGLEVEAQRLPARIGGLLPASQAWRLISIFMKARGMRVLSALKYRAGRVGGRRPYFQTHAAFHFLLDYLPNWKNAFRPHGLVQYQLFVPAGAARWALEQAIICQHRHGVTSHLAVLKRHRSDPFASSYAVDGFSLALDFAVQPRRLARLVAMVRDLEALRREVGGRIYAAKDALCVGDLPLVRESGFSSNLVRRWERGGASLTGSRPRIER